MHLADELLEHFFGHRKIGNDAILERPDRYDVAGCSTQHLFCIRSHRRNAARATGTAVLANGHDRWFIENNALATDIDKGVGRAEIDRQVIGEKTAQTFEHEL